MDQHPDSMSMVNTGLFKTRVNRMVSSKVAVIAPSEREQSSNCTCLVNVERKSFCNNALETEREGSERMCVLVCRDGSKGVAMEVK